MIFKLNPALDSDKLSREFRSFGRLQIRNLLAREDAERLHASLVREQYWRLTLNAGSKVFEFSAEDMFKLKPLQRKLLQLQVNGGAQTGFQYHYHALRIPEGRGERLAGDDVRWALAAWLSEGAGLDFLRTVTGFEEVNFVDGQVTAYRPGDFLTVHDDAEQGTSRRAAYVLNLTKDWRPDWGGLLLFHDQSQLTGWSPSFNTLNIFTVPQPHSVTAVAASAPRPRYSISGWLRTGSRPT